MATERELIIPILKRIFGEDKVKSYEFWNNVTVEDVHTCYDSPSYGGTDKDLEFEFDDQGNLVDLYVD